MYIEIISVGVPVEPQQQGATVPVYVPVKNIWTGNIRVTVTGAVITASGVRTNLYFDNKEAWITPGNIVGWLDSFIMPSEDVTVYAWAFYWNAEQGWLEGDKGSSPVKLGVAPVKYTLTINIDGQGATNPSEGSHDYDEGSSVTIVATPASGWRFDHWGGDVSGTNPSISITMNSNKNVTAYFVVGEALEGEISKKELE